MQASIRCASALASPSTSRILGKIGPALHITANGRPCPGGKLGLVLILMTAAGGALSLEATFCKDRAQAQDLFRLASLARWGLERVPAASPLQGGGDAER